MREFIEFHPNIDSSDEAGAPKEIPVQLGRMLLISEGYCDPAIAEYLALRSADVKKRADEITMQKVAESTAELLRIWESPEDGAWAFRQHNHHGK